ncbi:MAG: DUF4292 domain-containing protein [Bacteroidetes bacterium]|nr:DUF4292 domain-containing protein [Bacteroidota bacterium]
MTNFQVSKLPVILLLLMAVWFSSCRTAREIPTTTAKSISASKLLKKVEQNAFDYKHLTIKKIGCQFLNNHTKTNFNVRLKALKNEKILISISKLKIPVGRVLLTPDSVKYVNYIDREYFIDDYSYLSSFLNIDLDFATIQSIISNNAFSYRNDSKNKDFKTFDSFIENGMHVLQSEKTRKIFRMEEKQKTGKIERRMKRLDDKALILQKMYFNPSNFALTQLVINDKTNNRIMNMNFDDFIKVQNKDYPGMIDMSFNSEASEVKLKIRMSGFSTDKINSISIKIPEKYKQIRMN